MSKKTTGMAIISFLIIAAGTAFAEQEIDWSTQANSLRGQNGLQVAYYCPPGNPVGRLWGTDLYTDDSSICTAAVHAGQITPETGGSFYIEIRPGASSYRGSNRYGITSNSYGGWHGSFMFVSGHKHGRAEFPQPYGFDAHPKHNRDSYIPKTHSDVGFQRGVKQISWTTQADKLRGKNGLRLTYFCPPGGSYSGRLWGSNPYTDDSSVCLAGVHSGLFTPETGGNITIEIRPGASSYNGSSSNGVNSNNYGGWHGSFYVMH